MIAIVNGEVGQNTHGNPLQFNHREVPTESKRQPEFAPELRVLTQGQPPFTRGVPLSRKIVPSFAKIFPGLSLPAVNPTHA
jgi:hypothetical protein